VLAIEQQSVDISAPVSATTTTTLTGSASLLAATSASTAASAAAVHQLLHQQQQQQQQQQQLQQQFLLQQQQQQRQQFSHLFSSPGAGAVSIPFVFQQQQQNFLTALAGQAQQQQVSNAVQLAGAKRVFSVEHQHSHSQNQESESDESDSSSNKRRRVSDALLLSNSKGQQEGSNVEGGNKIGVVVEGILSNGNGHLAGELEHHESANNHHDHGESVIGMDGVVDVKVRGGGVNCSMGSPNSGLNQSLDSVNTSVAEEEVSS
jgi:hypothetical protein